ncbi:MAG: ATP-binding cassette domain-containing protein [Chitinophagales bacterium]
MAFQLSIHQFSKNQQPIFSDFMWTIKPQENWAILGNIGTGKTILLKLFAGLEFLSAKDGSLTFADNLTQKDVEYISFSDDKKWIKRTDYYYQQRYYTTYSDDEFTLEDFLQVQALDIIQQKKIKELLEKYTLNHLLTVPFIQLSNGQKNKAILIKAIQSSAQLFLLDNPFIGIDAKSRESIFQLIDTLIQQGKPVIYTTNYPIFAASTTHVLTLKKNFKFAVENKNAISIPAYNRVISSIKKEQNTSLDQIIELNHISISYHHKIVLDDISWQVFKGEKWAIVGENGSGKSTLMSLLYADHPQAYKYDIQLFGQPRNRQSIWEIKARTGYLSPEFHLHFNEPLTVIETIGTGYTDTLTLLKKLNDNQLQYIESILEYFSMNKLRNRYFLSLSQGEQRLVLFLRAIIKQPELLILDEPYQGLDEQTIARCNEWLCSNLQPTQTLIFTSHYSHEIPDIITHCLSLEKGKIIANG